MPQDEDLVKEINNGSEAAMEVLIRKYYKQIFAFVYRKTGDKDTAYDLTQGIFIKVLQRINSYNSKGSFKSWLFAIAINHCRDFWRSTDYKVVSNQVELKDNIENKQVSVSYIFEKNETRMQIKSAIDELPEFQKEVILLKFYHDMKIKEISYITNTNESTVKSRIRQGIQKLKDILKRGDSDDQERLTK